MKRIFTIVLIFTFNLFAVAQTNKEAMEKFKNIKDLYELEMITQEEFDSIAKQLKEIILNSKVENENSKIDGFYIGEKRLIPERFAESKTDILGAALTYGIAGGSTKSYLSGAVSRNVQTSGSQVFTLLINQNVDMAGNNLSTLRNQQFFSEIQSPNDFALVKLNSNVRGKERWIKTGSMSLAGGYSYQVKKKQYIKFEWEEVEPTLFKITSRLPIGQYAFIFVGQSSFSNNAIYTFSIFQ